MVSYKRKVTNKRYKKRYYGKKLNKRQKKQVKAIISRDIETKCFSQGYGHDTGVTTNGSVHDLSLIQVGDGQGFRQGNIITLKKIVFTSYITMGQSAFIGSDAWANIRIIIFRWREDTAVATPTLNDLLDITSVVGASTFGVQLPYNYNTRQKYDILWDKLVRLAPEPEFNGSDLEMVVGGPNANKIVKRTLWGKKMGNKRIKYNDNAAVSANGYNKLYVVFTSDSGATPHVDVRWATQLFYDDA